MGKLAFWLIVIYFLVWLISFGYQWDWTGFNAHVEMQGIVPPKYLWDWMELLLIPAVITSVGLWVSNNQKNRELEIAHDERELDREIAERERELERRLAQDRIREERLQGYLDRMSELLLDKGLRNSEPGSEVRGVARARTLSVVRTLDGRRKASVLQFLKEANLIQKDKPVIDLRGCDFSKALLHDADLRGTNLNGIILLNAQLEGANLGEAELKDACCENANFKDANLTKADLTASDLSRAKIVNVQAQLTLFSLTLVKGARFENANLVLSRFSGVNFAEVESLNKCDLRRATLDGAFLTENQKKQNQLEGANFDYPEAELGKLLQE